MSKYINADRLKAEIDRLEEEARKVRVSGTDKEAIGADGKVSLCLKLKSLIDSLQQEQPSEAEEDKLSDFEEEIHLEMLLFAGRKQRGEIVDEKEYVRCAASRLLAHARVELKRLED